MIRRVLAVTSIVAMAMSMTSEGRQVATTRGPVIEAIQRGSAFDEAGLKPGDELVSWTRSEPSSTGPVAHGEFRTPFDAREFEIEQLPRGGASVVAVHDGRQSTVRLLPGAPGVTVRPAFSENDLALYEAGRASEKARPSDALVTWQPLIDRAVAADDVATAAWLITRVASAFAALDPAERADELFERAAAMFREPANPSREATVWETKALVLYPDDYIGAESQASRPVADIALLQKPHRVDAALEALARGVVMRTSIAPQSLAVAQMEIDFARIGSRAVFYGVFLDAPPEERRVLEQIQTRVRHAETTFANLAPGSASLAGALHRRWAIDSINWSGQRSSGTTRRILENSPLFKQGEPSVREAFLILETVAPKHDLTKAVASSFTNVLLNMSLTDKGLLASGGPLEDAAKRRVTLAERSGDRTWLEVSTFGLAQVLVFQGARWEAVSITENLLRTGSKYSDLAGRFRSLAGTLNQALAIDAWERVNWLMLSHLEDAPASQVEQAGLLSRLVSIGRDRGDLATAEALAIRWLALEERAAAQSPAVTKTPAQVEASTAQLTSALFALAQIVNQRGDRDRAVELARRAVALEALLKEPSVLAQQRQASQLLYLADLTGDLAAMERYAERGLALVQRGKGLLSEAPALHNAAVAQIKLGHNDKATAFLEELLPLRRRQGGTLPGTPAGAAVAGTLRLLGRLAEEPQVAFRYFDEALDILEDARGRLSSGWAESWFGGTDSVYVDFVDRLVTDGQLARAFQVVERSRGRALRARLAARDGRDPFSVPAPLRDERRRLGAEYDEAQGRLETLLVLKDTGAIEAGRQRLRELELQLTGVNVSIARSDPGTAVLQRPKPISLAEARARLDPGTVLLSYLVGPEFAYVFVVTPPSTGASGDAGVTVHRIDMGEQQLRQSIDAFRTLIRWDSNPAQSDRVALRYRGRELYDALVRPAEAQIGAAQRVLVSLDGPLHALPFDALVRDRPTGGSQYFVEWKPLHTAISMSGYAETPRAQRPTDRTGSLVAFGDPKYPVGGESLGDTEVGWVLRSGAQMTPLPGTRREVGAIASLFGSRATTYLGASATEARARTIDPSTRYIHFAVHGWLNESLPMNSALAFTVPESPRPGEPNGLLQAWEIIEKIRVDADLVTLSACESGLGKQVAGEGFVGLTSAFLFAGARTVAASLWKVADGPTAELMTRFYRNLRDGQTKDEALRHAQLALIKMGRPKGSSIDYSSPAHWAAFTLTGDWR